MFKDKILFIFKRYKYNNNKILAFKNLSFLLKILFIIIIRFFYYDSCYNKSIYILYNIFNLIFIT